MNQKTTLAIAIAIVGGVAISVASPWNPKSSPMPILSSQRGKSDQADLETRTSSLNMNASGIKNIKVDIELGSLEISTNSGNSFNAQITKGISRPLGEVERQWMDNPWLKVRRDGDTLVVYEDKSLKPNLKSLNKNRQGNNQLNMAIIIQIPKGLNADLSLTAGSEVISGEYRSLTTHVTAGELNLNQVDSGDFLKVNVDAGEVNAKLARVPSEASSINVLAGEINLDVSGNATIFAKSKIGSISASGKSDEDQHGLGSMQQIKLGSGGTKFTLDVGAGSINVGNGIIEKRSKRDKEDDIDLESDLQIDLINDKEIQREITASLNEAKAQINGADIQKEVANALKEAKSAMNSIDIEDEVARAMKESKVDIEAALKDADREIAKAMREVEIEMDNVQDADGRYRYVSRETLKMVKQILDQARSAMKKSIVHKPAKKKISHD